MDNLKNAIKHRISRRKNRRYLSFHAQRKKRQNTDLHHIIGKRNDYLIAEVPHEQHIANPNSFDFVEMLIESIEKMADYIEYLDDKNYANK